MFDWPPANHTSPTSTSWTFTSFAASVRPSFEAGIGLRFTRQPPCASATASADCPANVTVTFSPGAAVPHTATGLSRCSTM